MTEAEWLACRTSRKLLGFLRGRVTERKLRLIGCGCCRLYWSTALPREHRTALDTAERIADGTATATEAEEGFWLANYARDLATGTLPSIPRRYKTRAAKQFAWAVYNLVELLDTAHPDYFQLSNDPVSDALDQLSHIPNHPSVGRWQQARVIRDVVGNPFRPTTVDPSWLTPTVLALASGIYADRAFDRLPILADALQDAGCDNADFLSHCRDDGPHVRGCWVVDLVLGKG